LVVHWLASSAWTFVIGIRTDRSHGHALRAILCGRCGWSTTSHFIDTFRRITNRTPGSYRPRATVGDR
jgi:hypothetical protein